MQTIAVLAVSCVTALAAGQAAAQLPTLAERSEMYFRYLEIPDRMPGLALLEPHWLPDGDRFWYAAGAPEETVIFLVDPVANTRAEMFDTERLRKALGRVLGHPPPHRGLPFDDFSFLDEGERAVRFTVDGNHYRLDLPSYSIRPLEGEPAEPPSALESGGRWGRGEQGGPYFAGRIDGVPSPDGEWVLEDEDHDLWLRSTRGGDRTRLTSDGEADHPWHVVHPEYGDWWQGPPPLGNWSPDGRLIAVWRSARRALELHIGELHEDGVRWVQVDTVDTNVGGFRWRPDGSELWFDREADWSKRLDLLAADPRTGKARLVLTETAETFVDWTANARYDLLHFLEDGERFIWRSNRDGWYDLYLYDVDGDLVRRLTEGPFEVSWPYAIDEGAGWIYFGVFGAGDRPYDTYVHRVRLDGSGFERLTHRNGQPGPYGFSPSKKFFLLHRSTPTEPEVVELRRADGTLLQTLARQEIAWLDELHWHPPEEFVVKAGDGSTELHGRLYKPWDFDPDKKYPVVQVVYGNPSFSFHVFSPWFGGTDKRAPALAQLGFVTFVVEERGTHGRGKAFRDVLYRDEVRPQVADDVATLRQLAAERPYMDLDRVGIVGGSYGGHATIRNMLLAPDVYHVGVARSARWSKWLGRLYGAPYREIPEVYERASSLTYAGNLEGRLLLAQATDDNLEQVMTLIEALTEAGKFYDLMILPEGGHSLTERHPKYFHEARIRYLVEHLEPEIGDPETADRGGEI